MLDPAAARRDTPPSDDVADDHAAGDDFVPIRYWILLVLSFIAGLVVLRSRPAGQRRRHARDAWRGRIKPPPPPPVPPGPPRGR